MYCIYFLLNVRLLKHIIGNWLSLCKWRLACKSLRAESTSTPMYRHTKSTTTSQHTHTHTTMSMHMICSTLAYGQAKEPTLGIASLCTFFFSHSLFKEMSLQIRRLPSDIRTQVSVWEPGHHRHLSSHAEFLGLFRLGTEIPFLDGRAFQKTFATSNSLLRVLCLITFVIITMRYFMV